VAVQLQFDFERLLAPEQDLLKPGEAARLLTIDPMTLRRYRRDGKIRFIKYGDSTFRYLKHDIIEFLKTRYTRTDYIN
jgi:excisionase family DNA binding protein